MKALLFFVFFIPFASFSQQGRMAMLDRERENDVFLTRLSDFIPDEEKYTYPVFKEGRLFYIPHRESDPILLNYNKMLKHIEMIADNGDTISIPNFEIIKYILINTDLYYHDFKKGYFQTLSSPDDSIMLVAQRWLHVKTHNELGDTDYPQITSNPEYFTTIYHPLNRTLNRQWVSLTREISFFLIDQTEEIHAATKGVFIKVFPKHKQQIEDYLSQMVRQEEEINFHREADLKKLLSFCLALH